MRLPAPRRTRCSRIKPAALAALGDIPARPPNFCTGCPERPVFAAIKLAQREIGPIHICADIGCHSFATFAPFSLGNSILGYGMSLASAAGGRAEYGETPDRDHGRWRLLAQRADHRRRLELFNKGDGVLVIMQNGYASATGQQYLPSSTRIAPAHRPGSGSKKRCAALGVKWLRTVRSYSVAKMAATLKEAMRSAERGLKVIIADGECMLARQRRIRAEEAEKLKRGERVVKTRFGVDDELCTGDHSCIRLSGCPSLTVKPNPDPLRRDPVAAVIESCVGCGLCGEVAHAAVLCPSFYRADIVTNPNWWDRTLRRLRSRLSADCRGGARGAAPWAVGSCRTPESPPPWLRTAGDGSALRQAHQGERADRPITILIAALGGEGGGVLTDWIVAAAASQDFPVQSTSIPGVAQRTGATTYHIEMVPAPMPGTSDEPAADPGAGAGRRRRRPSGRERTVGGRPRLAGGFITPDRTTPIASTSRSYLVVEKMAMSDGRYDPQRLIAAVEKNSRQALLLDFEAIAREAGAMINAVLLGAIAGARRTAHSGRGFRGGDPRRRQSGRGQSARLPRRMGGRDGAGSRQPPNRPSARRRSPATRRSGNRNRRACPPRRKTFVDRRRAPP